LSLKPAARNSLDLIIDWSVCLLTLKHLVSLQARCRPSVEAELDLHTSDRWEERDIKKENVIFVPLNVCLIRDALQSFFFFRLDRSGKVIIGVWVGVCTLLLFVAFYSYRVHYSMCVFYYYLHHYIHTD
jgi:hypothetical protein